MDIQQASWYASAATQTLFLKWQTATCCYFCTLWCFVMGGMLLLAFKCTLLLKGWRLFALLLKNYGHHLGRVESFPFSLVCLAQHSYCNHYCSTRWSVVPLSTWKRGCETNQLIMMKSNIYKTEFTHYNQLIFISCIEWMCYKIKTSVIFICLHASGTENMNYL